MSINEEVLTINIEVTGAEEVKGNKGETCMISFKGTCDCKNFKGDVLPTGIDTQREYYGEYRTLSARYIMVGTDCDGQPCRIFIENNGEMVGGEIGKTTPRILTDSKALAYLEESELYGTIEGIEKGVRIHIFMK